MEEKNRLRTLVREAIVALDSRQRREKSSLICHRIMEQRRWTEATTILLYSSLPDEVDTEELISAALAEGKTIVLPCVEAGNLILREFTPGNQIIGRFGIIEPSADSQTVPATAIDLAIIPGRAFTSNGARLGRGKGFYDRILPRLTCQVWGICFSCQIVESIPTEEWDMRVSRVFHD